MSECLHVLVCDDSKVSRIMSMGLLKKLAPGCMLHEAGHADEARALLAAHPVSLLLLDHNMPGITGLEFAQEVRQSHPLLHVALLTANIQDATQTRAADLGVEFYRKPITQAVIAEVLSRNAEHTAAQAS